MKLLYRITFRISVVLLVLFAAWSALFYYIIIDEINDETDDSLEDYSEYIISRALAGESLPEKDNGTNNTYYLTPVSEEFATNNPSVQFLEDLVYIQAKKETEPARIYKTIFRDRENNYFELTVMIPTIEKKDLQETILSWIIILYILLLLAIIIVNAIVLRRSLKPLYVILDWIDKLSLGKETAPLNTSTDITEFRKLSDALVRSANRNAEMYEQQSLFIGHASHELQTPIAIAQNRLELLADDPTLNEQQLSQVMSTTKTLHDISKLNRTLLLLTKIENRQFPDSSEINANALLKTLSSDFDEAYKYLNIKSFISNAANLKLRMNETLATILFSNLLKNAYLYNRKGGEIHIVIEPKSIRISNTATEGALNPEYIFKRFYKSSKNENSTGLGLSLVESIGKLYEMNILYRFDENLHHFEIRISDGLIVS